MRDQTVSMLKQAVKAIHTTKEYGELCELYSEAEKLWLNKHFPSRETAEDCSTIMDPKAALGCAAMMLRAHLFAATRVPMGMMAPEEFEGQTTDKLNHMVVNRTHNALPEVLDAFFNAAPIADVMKETRTTFNPAGDVNETTRYIKRMINESTDDPRTVALTIGLGMTQQMWMKNNFDPSLFSQDDPEASLSLSGERAALFGMTMYALLSCMGSQLAALEHRGGTPFSIEHGVAKIAHAMPGIIEGFFEIDAVKWLLDGQRIMPSAE